MADHEDKLRRLLEVGRALVGELDLEAVLQRILEEARELTGARYVAVGVLDETRTQLERFLTVGLDAATHRRLLQRSVEQGISGGRVYDAAILACGSMAGAEVLLTFNERHFRSLDLEQLDIVVPS